MQYLLSFVALAGYAAAQGVTALIPPPGGYAAGCSPDYSGTFGIQTVYANPSRKRQYNGVGSTLSISLANGVLTDSKNRRGYIAANQQFQFDGPPQTGAIYTSGWSICPNNSLALGPQLEFYQCKSGSFYNIYDTNAFPAHCIAINIQVVGSGSTSGSAPAPAPAPAPATAPAPAPAPAPASGSATQITDGQVQAPTPAVTQITDGQIQAPTPAAAVTQITDGQIQAPSPVAAVTQITDGQIQAPTPGAAYTPPAPVYTGAASSNQIGGAVALVAGAFAALL